MSTTFYCEKMATTGVGFRWLDILEKEFDKACVELDTSLADLETEEPDVVFSARQKIATLGSCFSQLTHKALTIFQNSAKLEAELVDMRAELVQARAASAGGCQESGDAAGNVPEAARARAEAAQLARENAALRETVLALHSELFGARLATKYLDKELAGRIQQLQLLGRDMRAEVRDSLWAQVEAEILLQRHKTLVRVCRGLSPWPARPLGSGAGGGTAPHRARPRTVRVRRSPHLGLGISVTGGREHGVPILISELEAGGPAALSGQLYVGDAILAINDVDLTQACHKEAVQALQSVKGDCALCVQFIATDDDDRLSEDNYRFPLYPEDGEVFEREPDGSGATPTAPRTPDYNRRDSEVESGSECEAVVRCVEPPPAHVTHGPHVTHAPHATQTAYPDYNNINNNLDILDMDDDSIKIDATRIEWGGVVGVGQPGVGVVNSARYSSGESPHSTPVHARHHAAKKKRKPLDWRTKGTYRAIDVDAPSSDEPHADLTRSVDHTPDSELGPESPLAVPTAAPDVVEEPAVSALVDVGSLPAPTPADLIKLIINGDTKLRRESKGFRYRYNNADGVEEPISLADTESSPAPAKPQPLEADAVKHTANGDVKRDARRGSKGFRIGSARRVTEPATLVNGAAPPTAPTPAPAPAMAATVAQLKLPPRLRTGDGDPDFGTPV